VLDILIPEPGAFYVMDRGYLDFERTAPAPRATLRLARARARGGRETAGPILSLPSSPQIRSSPTLTDDIIVTA
jgi:hypothetical protein